MCVFIKRPMKQQFHCHPNRKYNCQYAKNALRQFFILTLLLPIAYSLLRLISTTGRKYRTYVLKNLLTNTNIRSILINSET